jgi:signal transduction histidine kinase
MTGRSAGPEVGIDDGLAHDVNHVIGLVAGYAALVDERVRQCQGRNCWSDEEIEEVIQDSAGLLACIERMVALAGRLVGAAAWCCPERLDLNRVVLDLEPLLGRARPHDGVRLEHHLAEGLWPVITERLAVDQVLLNLCGNAREAMVDGGVLVISTDNVLVDSSPGPEDGRPLGGRLVPGPHVRLAVADTGPGMPAAVLARAGDPGFSTRVGRTNLGLGLTTVRRVMDRIGGGLWLWSEPGRGTVARAYLVAAPP